MNAYAIEVYCIRLRDYIQAPECIRAEQFNYLLGFRSGLHASGTLTLDEFMMMAEMADAAIDARAWIDGWRPFVEDALK